MAESRGSDVLDTARAWLAAEPDEEPRAQQRCPIRREGLRHRAHQGEPRQRGDRPARPCAIQRDANRDLRDQQRREEHPVRGTQHGRAQREVFRQFGRDDAERRAVELRQPRHGREGRHQHRSGALA